MDQRLSSVEKRLAAVEGELTEIKLDVLAAKTDAHKAKNESMKATALLADVQKDIADIKGFVTGTSKVFGFARKHWRALAYLSAGFMLAEGLGNPQVAHAIQHIAALP